MALRTAIVMSRGRGGAFNTLRRMVKVGLGGPVAGGGQYVSWLHPTFAYPTWQKAAGDLEKGESVPVP